MPSRRSFIITGLAALTLTLGACTSGGTTGGGGNGGQLRSAAGP